MWRERPGSAAAWVLLICLLPACSSNPTIAPAAAWTPQLETPFPAQSDWVNYGIILKAGVHGEWDHYLWDGFAFTVIQAGNQYYLYYQGASDYRTQYDETLLWRAIGVATSQDGIHFSKSERNPILTWFPNQHGEEGAVSSAAAFGERGEIILFYGANAQESPTTINADVRAASSADGLRFTDLELPMNHKDRSVWGSGDELFRVSAIHDQGRWIVYYIPNGTSQSGKLGVAYGNQYNALSRSSAVTSDGRPIPVWRTASLIKLNGDSHALILNNVRDKRTEVRLTSLTTPNIASKPVAVYQFDDVQQAVLLLDREKPIWFLYYRTNENTYGAKLAPLTTSKFPALPTP